MAKYEFEEPEKVTTMAWVFLILAVFVLASIGIGILSSCSGRFSVDASAIPHVIKDIEKAEQAI